MIYFLKRSSDGLIKIGTSIRLSQRLKQLRAENSETTLDLLAVMHGGIIDEKLTHLALSRARVKGEWFQPTPDVLDFIAENADEWDGVDEAPYELAPTALTIEGALEWRAWVERGAEHCRTDVAKLVDAALVEYLKAKGFTEAPPRR